MTSPVYVPVVLTREQAELTRSFLDSFRAGEVEAPIVAAFTRALDGESGAWEGVECRSYDSMSVMIRESWGGHTAAAGCTHRRVLVVPIPEVGP